MKQFFGIVIFLVTLFLTASQAQAFSVSPLKFETTVDPGATEALVITVFNSEKVSRQFRIMAIPITMDEKGHPQYGTVGNEVTSWLSFGQTVQTVGPQATKKIVVTVAPPLGTEPGTRIVAVGVQEEVKSAGSVGLSARAAIPLYITVAGKVKEMLSINQWDSVQEFPTTSQWPMRLKLQNEGTIRLPLAGKIIVRDSNGTVISSSSINLGNELFPGTSRILEPTIIGGNAQIFFPKRYSATVLIQYGASRTLLSELAVLWVVPTVWWIFGSVMGGALVVILVYMLFFKRKKFVPKL